MAVKTDVLEVVIADLQHTYTQPLNSPLSGTTGGRPVTDDTFTHSHPSRSPNILYQLPPSITIDSIILIQFTCLTVPHNLSPNPPWSTSWVWNPLLHTPYISSPNHYLFCNTCPYHRNLFCCNTKIMSSIPNLSHKYTKIKYLTVPSVL